MIGVEQNVLLMGIKFRMYDQLISMWQYMEYPWLNLNDGSSRY